MKKYSIIDIETTGGSRDGNKITEIAIINLDGDDIVEEFSTLINPERNIPLNITYLTGITNQMVQDAPKFYEVAKKIVEMTEGRIFVAHNVFFDYNFFKREFNDLGFQFRREKLCTVRLARKYLPGHDSYSLGKICSDLGIDIDGRHRALGDARATAELFQKILDKVEDKDLVESEAKQIVLPALLERDNFDRLPNKTGVYYFYNQKGELLYIGKSKDIKKRVTQHFRPNLNRKKDILLKNSIAQIEYKVMDNELAALLFEAHEIKTHRPPFNVSLKARKFSYGVKLVENKEGILYPKLFSSVEDEEFIYRYKSKNSAQKKIDNTYKNILGDISLFDSIEHKVSQMVNILGLEQFNKLIYKTFHFNMPDKTDFELTLINLPNKSCKLEIIDRKPYAIHYLYDDENEVILLRDDPQLKAILWAYLNKE